MITVRTKEGYQRLRQVDSSDKETNVVKINDQSSLIMMTKYCDAPNKAEKR